MKHLHIPSLKKLSCRFNLPVTVFLFLIFAFSKSLNATPCALTCPPDVEVSTASGLCSVVVNYPPVVATCGAVTFSPADGSSFPVGITPVTATSESGETCQFNVKVNATPIDITVMHGQEVVCRGTSITYCIPPVQGAITYNWTVPAGATGSSNSNCITVTFGPTFTDGSLIVTAVSGCGSAASTALILSVALAKPAKPAAIHPGGPVCAGSTQFFCASFVPETEDYVFSIAGNGGSAPLTLGTQIGTCITVNIPAGYNNKQELRVRAVNCKGQSGETKLDIKVLDPPNMPGNITGPGTVCLSQLGFYSVGNVKNASQYNWTVSDNVWIAGGQGSNNLALDYMTATSTSVLLSVTAENACGISPARTKTISVLNSCKEASEEYAGEESITLDANVFPNPTSGKVTLEYYSTTNSNSTVKLFDMTGRIVSSYTFNSTEGMNSEVLDFEHLLKQIYLLRFENDTQSKTIRVAVN